MRPNKNCKILIAGLGGVGKTTIAQKLAGTLDLSEDRKMTPGIDFHQLEVSQENLILAQIWDLGGQNHFRPIQDSFFKSAHIVMLVFSVVRYPSWLNIDTWIPLIKKDDLIKLYLIGNKIDDVSRVVPKEEAHKFAIDNHMEYFEISALTGLGFEEFQKDLIDTIMNTFSSQEKVERFLNIKYQKSNKV